MIEVLIMIAIFTAILKYVEKPIIEDIKNSKTSDEAIKNRKRLKKCRYSLLLVFLVLYLGGSIYLNYILDPEWYKDPNSYKGIILAFIWSIIELSKKTAHSPLCKVSTISKSDVLRSGGDYIIYLRGFENDNYDSVEKLRNQKSFSVFSEYHFIKEVSNYLPVYAVGMTKEIECPRGAERLYLSDSTWKEDVRELMEKAKLIVILVDDKVNCLWEIEQARSMLTKTIFVVDDVSKHNKALDYLKNVITLPKIDNSQSYYYLDNDNWIIKGYTNSIDSYKTITKDVIPNKTDSQKGYYPSWRKKVGIGFLIFIIAFVIGVAIGFALQIPAPGIMIFMTIPLGFIVYKIIINNKSNLQITTGNTFKDNFRTLPKSLKFIFTFSAIIHILLILSLFRSDLFVSDPSNLFYDTIYVIITLIAVILLQACLIGRNLTALCVLTFFPFVQIPYAIVASNASLCCGLSGIINCFVCGMMIQKYYNGYVVPRTMNIKSATSLFSITALTTVFILLGIMPYLAGFSNDTQRQYYKYMSGLHELIDAEKWDDSYNYKSIADDYADIEDDYYKKDYFVLNKDKAACYYLKTLNSDDVYEKDDIYLYLARYYKEIRQTEESQNWYRKYLELLNDGYEYLEFESEAKKEIHE